jgi:hypothetical protein
MMNKTENTLYILQNLSTTESKDLDYAEIDVYYEDEQGNEGAAQYDMPAIADDAISTINELQAKIAELEKQLGTLKSRSNQAHSYLNSVTEYFYKNDQGGNYYKNLGECEDLLAIRDLEQQAKGLSEGFHATKEPIGRNSFGFMMHYCSEKNLKDRVDDLRNQAKALEQQE